MKKILIISPHFPPSNLAAVHRSRLFAQHLPAFGWEPIILTVNEKYYEEKPDHHLKELLSPYLRIEKVNALPITTPRLIGDIGLRAFFQIAKKAIHLVRKEKIDFLYTPVPSFYMALIGRLVHARTGVAYGVDYIDPWVHTFEGSQKLFSRHWWSTRLSFFLEPIAVKKASLITGVAEGYYEGVSCRNPHLKKQAIFAAMPYGGEKNDHIKLSELQRKPCLFTKKQNKIQLVYAGTMLPKAFGPLMAVIRSIIQYPLAFENMELIFIGTGKNPLDSESYTIKAIAEEYGLWQKNIFEYPERIPYLEVLSHLQEADGIFILGSTEQHYTPSKVYQAVLSHKPVLAILHRESSAKGIIENSLAGIVLAFDGEGDLNKITDTFKEVFEKFNNYRKNYSAAKVDFSLFNKYSAYGVTSVLADMLEKVVRVK